RGRDGRNDTRSVRGRLRASPAPALTMDRMFARRAGIAGATLAGVATLVVGVWLLRTFDPNAASNPFPACVFLTLTGFYCAGCGATRALHALVHGDFTRALAMNPLLVAVLPLMPVLGAWSLGWRPAALRPFVRRISSPWG